MALHAARRAFLRGGAFGLAALGLAGCGFTLRRTPQFAFASIGMPGNSAYQIQLRRALGVGGTVRVLGPEQLKAGEQPEVIFEELGQSRDRAIVSTNSAGQVREMQLRLSIKFRLRTPQGKEWIGPIDIVQARDITYNETAALAKENEEQLLYRDMTADLVQQTVRRLGAVKAP